ncbi:hypothetical protein KKB99_00770 [bacterium]|nr:hypothetical protein [bacterium]MBU1024518.1 hypothetical protein [bacterium]
MSFYDKLLKIDRRWIYLLVAIAVIVPLLKPLRLPVTLTEPAENIFKKIETLPEGSHVLISVDFAPSSEPELKPMIVALYRHCFAKKLKLVTMTLEAAGAALAEDALSITVNEFNANYRDDLAQKGEEYVLDKYGVLKGADEDYLVKGEDYTYLGYKAGYALVVLGLGDSFTNTFSKDYSGEATSSQPIFKDMKSLSDLDLMIDIASTAAVEMWITYGKERYKFDMGAGCTAVSATQYYPFLNSGQLLGLLGGLKGAAEYEKMIVDAGYWVKPGLATTGMDAQSIVHFLTVVIVIITNFFYLIRKRRAGEKTNF